jgi:transcription initiation factor TFIID subunit 2
VRDRVADYFKLISNPMDLSSISNKLNEGLYKDRSEFRDDFFLVVSNAKTYTPDEKAYVHIEAVSLEKEFNAVWNRITKTLEQAAAKAAQVNTTTSNGNTIENGDHAAPATEPQEAGGSDDVEATQVSMAPPPIPPSKGLGIKIKLKPKSTPSEVPSSPQPTVPASIKTTNKNQSPQIKAAKQASPVPVEKRAAPSYSPSPSPSSRLSSSPAPIRKQSQQPSQSGAATTSEQDMPIHPKRCRAVLQVLKKQPEAFIFLRPVDPVADGVPTYLHEIKHPMDLGTMENKLNTGMYSTMSGFYDDAILIFENCRLFNPVGTVPVVYADTLERLFLKEWKTAMIPKLEYAETRALQAILTKLKAVPSAYLFQQAVDPIALGIPHYFEVVRKEDARDLSLMESKLKRGDYTSFRLFDEDIRLMLDNCYRFNEGDEGVIEAAKSFEKSYEKLWAEVKTKFEGARLPAASTKRKAESNGSANASRKKK